MKTAKSLKLTETIDYNGFIWLGYPKSEIEKYLEEKAAERDLLYEDLRSIQLAGKRGGYCCACGVDYEDFGDSINNLHCEAE